MNNGMKNKKYINSHVVIPKSILEKYAYIDGKRRHIIKYIDLNTLEIKEEKTSKFNTEIGYYSVDNEKILSDEAESRIGNVIKKLQEINVDTNFEQKDIESIYKFIAYQVIRTDFFSEKLKKEFEFDLDNKIIKNKFIEEEQKLNILYNIIRDTDMYVIVNFSNIKFVLPSNLMYTFDADTEEYKWITILSPDIALVLLRKGMINKIHNIEDEIKSIKIVKFENEQKDIINAFNLSGLGVQFKNNNEKGYIIGLENELKGLLNIIEKNKE